MACASASDYDEKRSDLAAVGAPERTDDEAHAQDPTAQIARAPDGRYEAEILTSGAGCPPGTTRIRLTDDGRAFELDFLDLAVFIDERASLATIDCVVTFRMKSRAGMSYAFGEATYRGTASLSAGMRAWLMSSAEFHRGPSWPMQRKTALTGPYAGSFQHVPTLRLVDWAYTPCGQSSTFSVTTRLMGINTSGTGRGEISLAMTDVPSTPAMIQPLYVKPCTIVGLGGG